MSRNQVGASSEFHLQLTHKHTHIVLQAVTKFSVCENVSKNPLKWSFAQTRKCSHQQRFHWSSEVLRVVLSTSWALTGMRLVTVSCFGSFTGGPWATIKPPWLAEVSWGSLAATVPLSWAAALNSQPEQFHRTGVFLWCQNNQRHASRPCFAGACRRVRTLCVRACVRREKQIWTGGGRAIPSFCQHTALLPGRRENAGWHWTDVLLISRLQLKQLLI